MLRAVLNESEKQHPTKKKYPTKLQRYGSLPPISQIIQVRTAIQDMLCKRSIQNLISDVILRNLTHGLTNVGRPANTYFRQLWVDK